MAANAALWRAASAGALHEGTVGIRPVHLLRSGAASPIFSHPSIYKARQDLRSSLYSKSISPVPYTHSTHRSWFSPLAAVVESASPSQPAFPIAILTRTAPLTLLLPPFCYLLLCLACGSASAAASGAPDSIRASGVGLKIAAAMRQSGWADEAVVFALATLPVLELRGAIPVGYWMQLDPLRITILSILGNMVPVPFVVLYLQKLASFLSRKSEAATRFLDLLLEKARKKAGPVEEFQWLGLMLFVAVPFPGTGAWTGAIIASLLGMPFWSAITANFFGVVLAGLLVNLLVNLGLKYAIVIGLMLFLVSSLMWMILRRLKESLKPK